MDYVTFTDLCQFMLVVIGFATLVLAIVANKKK